MNWLCIVLVILGSIAQVCIGDDPSGNNKAWGFAVRPNQDAQFDAILKANKEGGITIRSPVIYEKRPTFIAVYKRALEKFRGILETFNITYEEFSPTVNWKETPKLASRFFLEENYLDRYLRYEEVTNYLFDFALKYHDYVRVEWIGDSYDNRSIHLVRIGYNLSDTLTSPVAIIEAAVYGGEFLETSVTLYAMDQIVKDVRLMQEVEWWFIPILNPDGYEYSYGNDEFTIKSRAKLNGTDCVGVNLNFNFGTIDFPKGKEREDPCSNYYIGPKAFSEPETQALWEALSRSGNRLKSYISLHREGNNLLFAANPPRSRPGNYIYSDTQDSCARTAAALSLDIEYVKLNNAGVGRGIDYSGKTSTVDVASWFSGAPYAYTLFFGPRAPGPDGFTYPKAPLIVRQEISAIYKTIVLLARCANSYNRYYYYDTFNYTRNEE